MLFFKPSNLLLLLVCVFAIGCSSVKKAAVWVGETTGNEDLVKASADMTPRQEYYLGRSLSAQILTAQKPVDKKDLAKYINTLGQYLAMHSNRPETFAGYRFAAIEGEAPSAMSAPGGFIFISQGMINLANTEDELAAVIAHEIGHVELKHAEKNIQSSKRLSLGKKLFDMAANKSENKEGLKTFSKTIKEGLDISYNKGQEMEADRAAIRILNRAGYNAHGLHALIKRMPKSAKILSRHPRNKSRLKKLRERTASRTYASVPAARTERFIKFKTPPSTKTAAAE